MRRGGGACAACLRLAGVRKPGDLGRRRKCFRPQSHAKERGGTSNERMEFLGDSVLGFVTADWLFERYADEAEGLLTLRRAAHRQRRASLAHTARRLGFREIVRLGRGHEREPAAPTTRPSSRVPSKRSWPPCI